MVISNILTLTSAIRPLFQLKVVQYPCVNKVGLILWYYFTTFIIHPEKIQRHLRMSTTMHSPHWLYSMLLSCLRLLFTETLEMFIRLIDSRINHSFESGIFNESVHQYFFDSVLKRIDHPKMKILSLIAHPSVIPSKPIRPLLIFGTQINNFLSSVSVFNVHSRQYHDTCVHSSACKHSAVHPGQSQNASSASAAPHTCVMVLLNARQRLTQKKIISWIKLF